MLNVFKLFFVLLFLFSTKVTVAAEGAFDIRTMDPKGNKLEKSHERLRQMTPQAHLPAVQWLNTGEQHLVPLEYPTQPKQETEDNKSQALSPSLEQLNKDMGFGEKNDYQGRRQQSLRFTICSC